MANRHTARDCDESCSGCPQCYVATGNTVCSRLCAHAEEPDVLTGEEMMRDYDIERFEGEGGLAIDDDHQASTDGMLTREMFDAFRAQSAGEEPAATPGTGGE